MPRPSEILPRPTYYLELDGVPSCTAPLCPLQHPSWTCAHSTHKEAQQAALLVWRDYPDCVIAIKEGPCPRRDELREGPWDDYD